MSPGLAPPLQLLFLFMISGVIPQKWSVHYSSNSVSVLKGSTVTMGCNYTYPAGYTVQRVFWTKHLATEKEPPDLSSDPKYRDRVQYLGDRLGNCSLRLSGVTEQDQGKYYFRFITSPAEKYQGQDGVNLSVKGVPQKWSVHYSSKSVCALKGSTVTTSCNYTYPAGYTVQRVFWTKHLATEKEPPDLFSDPKYRDRVQYLGDRLGNCGLRLSGVTEQDQGKYYFRFITSPAEKYLGQDGVNLSVTVLQVEIPDTVIEGKAVTLTCKTSNRMSSNGTFTWYRSGHRLPSSTNLLHMPSVSWRDVGRYSCAVQNLQSCEVTLRLQSAPKNVSVSIRPSGEIVEGSSVTLTCSSDANPPVKTCTWYKGKSSIGTGKSYTINNISSVASGNYTCQAENKHGSQSSTTVSLNVLYPPKQVKVSIRPSSQIVEGQSVTLTCSSDANPPAEYSWFKGTLLKTKGKTYTIKSISSKDKGEYKCKSSNRYGEKHYDGAALDVLYPPKSISVSISPPGEIVEGGSVSLTCTSGANPPAKYDWFKGTLFIHKGKTYTIKNISSEDTGEYKCKSSNQFGMKYFNNTVNVLYPPKNVSVSIHHSGEIADGGSVNLTCSSDANPPVQTYTWYKVDESSPVGSGQSYSFTLSSNSSGWFYCVAQNKYGTQRAAAVPLTLNGDKNLVLYVGVGIAGGCGWLFVIIGVLCMRKKTRGGSGDDAKSFQNVHPGPPDDTYTALDLQTRSSNDVYHTLTNLYSSSTDDTYTALDLQTRSSNDVYHTLAAVHPSPPLSPASISLDSQSFSSDYCNLPITRNQH